MDVKRKHNKVSQPHTITLDMVAWFGHLTERDAARCVDTNGVLTLFGQFDSVFIPYVRRHVE